MRGLAQVYIEDDSSSSDSETISDPRAVKKRKIASNDEAQTEGSGTQTQSTKYRQFSIIRDSILPHPRHPSLILTVEIPFM